MDAIVTGLVYIVLSVVALVVGVFVFVTFLALVVVVRLVTELRKSEKSK